MIRINLLPFRAAKKIENIRMQISVYGLSVVLLMAVLGFIYMSLSSELNAVKEKNANLTKELASYSEMLKKIDELKKKRDDLKLKVEVIQGLEAKKAGPVQLFDEIAEAIPAGRLFLKSLSESKGIVTMSGVAKDYDTVALFMTKLENTKTIQAVTLGTTSKSVQEEQTISNFNLTCTKEGFEEVKKVKAAPKKGPKKKR